MNIEAPIISSGRYKGKWKDKYGRNIRTRIGRQVESFEATRRLAHIIRNT